MKYNLEDYLFTSESVSRGHPDKVCDQISDSILDFYLAINPNARVAVETMVSPGKVIIAGEIDGVNDIANDKIEQVIRQCIKDIGYEQDSFHWNKVEIENLLNVQSPDIAMGVDAKNGKDEGAGDQGIMFGYACDETEHYMPAPIFYAHKILRNIDDAIKSGKISKLGPDAKSQVSLRYRNGEPVETTSIVLSIQHDKNYSQEDVKRIVLPYIYTAFPNKKWICSEDEIYINPTGKFVIGGPESDAGLTGRKIIVDTYGGVAPHGGGAFSGKDPSKVDRSAAYAARYAAKNIVAAGLAKKCTIQLSYAIGVSKPLSIYINTHRTGLVSEQQILDKITALIDFSPAGIKRKLNLTRPIYSRTASFGHFGREAEQDGGFSWEKLDLVDDLKKILDGQK